MNILFRDRNQEKLAAAREIERWKQDHEQAMIACDVEDMVQEVLADHERDAQLLEHVLRRVTGASKHRIDEANRLVQEYCSNSIRLHDLVTECIRIVAAVGHPVKDADKLDEVTEEYRTWREDYPDLLAMAYAPVAKAMDKRIVEALQDESKEDDWQELFTDQDSCLPS